MKALYFALNLIIGLNLLSVYEMFGSEPVNEAGKSIVTETYYPVFPVLADRKYNILCEISVDAESSGNILQGVSIALDKKCLKYVSDVRLMWSGTVSLVHLKTTLKVMREQIRMFGGGNMLWCDPDFAHQLSYVKNRNFKDGNIALNCNVPLQKGRNYCYVSVRVDSRKLKDMCETITSDITGVKVSGVTYKPNVAGSNVRRIGIGVRQKGDDGVVAYRIPGLVTTKAGTLIGVYDIRYNSTMDLQSNIDIGVSRSTDKGRTWEKMRVAMDMGEWGGLPQVLNGIGDPSVLVDEKTGKIFIVALWTHDVNGKIAWIGAGNGMLPEETGQMMLCSSDDDGKTWSEPVNITSQIKKPEWYLTLQGPGRGITMEDGTLVFPYQYIDPDRIPHSGIIYSTDMGKTWHGSSPAESNTTESQVVEIHPGVLMLNMRDNRGTGRAVAVTYDMGKTWQKHPSSGQLIEPVCMASIIKVSAKDNILGKDILLFSNPADKKGRNHHTIKASLDYGNTWPESNSVLLDEEESWGYSCLTMIDNETVGILYEGSTANLVFQALKLKDIVKTINP